MGCCREITPCYAFDLRPRIYEMDDNARGEVYAEAKMLQDGGSAATESVNNHDAPVDFQGRLSDWELGDVC